MIEDGNQVMTIAEASRIVDALARGLDPDTGENIEDGHILRRPSVILALRAASKSIAFIQQRDEESESGPRNAGRAWTEPEDRRLLQEFDGGESLEGLALLHDRSAAGIAARLVRLHRISSRSDVYKRVRQNGT